MVFVGVYSSQFPSEALALMKYGEIVQDLAARGHNWHYYDENFRYLRQNQPSTFPWGVIHWELWMRSQQPVSYQNTLFLGTPFGHAFRSPALSLKVIALNFTRGLSVLDVPLSIPAPSVWVPME